MTVNKVTSLQVFILTIYITAVCADSSEENYSVEQRSNSNEQTLTLPKVIHIPSLKGSYGTTTTSPIIIHDEKYNPTLSSSAYVQSLQSYKPTTFSPLFLQTQKPHYTQQQKPHPIQVVEIPNQTHKPSNSNVERLPQIVVIPSKKPGRPSKPSKSPASTTYPPIYLQTQHQTENPVQLIQVPDKPTTVSTPIIAQSYHPHIHQPIQILTIPSQQQNLQSTQVVTLPNQQQDHQHVPHPQIQVVVKPSQQQGHYPIHPEVVQPNHEVEPQQETYQIYPGQLDNPTDYEFNWYVNNHESGDFKSHREIRQNDIVQGQYEVLDPDGYKRIVSYTADEVHGFRAVVRRIPLKTGYLQATNNNNHYLVTLTTQRPFGTRGRKQTSVTPLKDSNTEEYSEELKA